MLVLSLALFHLQTQTPKLPTGQVATPPVQVSPLAPSSYLITPPAKDKVVAKVNGTPILARDIEAVLWEWRSSEVLEDVVSLLLIRQEMAKQGLTVLPADVAVKVKETLKQAEDQKKLNKQDPNPNMSAADMLALQGYPGSRLYIRSEIELSIDKLALKNFKRESFIKISTMIFRPKNTTADGIAAATKASQKAYGRMKAGEAWNKVLESSPEADQSMLATHGLLGWRSLAAFPENLQKELPGLKPGGYTQPYQLPAGFQIFRVEVQGASAAGADLDELRNQFLARERQMVVSQIRSAAKIERTPLKPQS